MLVDNALSDHDLEKAAQAADSGTEPIYEPAQVEDTRSSSSTDPNSSEASTAARQAGAEDSMEPVNSSSEPRAAQSNPDPTDVGERPAPDAADSRFKQAQKERDRRERSWQALEEEKSAFRRERDAYLAERQRHENARPSAARDEHGYTAAEYEAYAAEQTELGNYSMADRAKARANELRAREPQTMPVADSAGPQPLSQEEWMQQVHAVVAQVPELAEETSPLAREVSGLLQSEPIFSQDPQGFAKAVTVSLWKLDAARVPELLKQVETQKSEIEKLNRALSIGGSNPLKPGRQRTYDGMSEAEKDDFIARQAAEADSIG